MAKQTENGAAADRTATKHPYNTLGTCLEVGKAVADHGGRNVASVLVTQSLGKAEGSSTFYQLAGSAKCFGIIEGSRELSLTDAGNDYFFPQSDTAKRRAILSFLAAPPLFRMVLDRFDGQQVPRAANLTNIFLREGISSSWASRAVAIFFNVLGESEVVDNSGHIRFKAEQLKLDRQPPESRQSDAIPDAPKPVPGPAMAAAQVLAESAESSMPSGVGANRWVYSEAGGTVRLETPDPIPRALWLRLKKYVDVLEPEDMGQEG